MTKKEQYSIGKNTLTVYTVNGMRKGGTKCFCIVERRLSVNKPVEEGCSRKNDEWKWKLVRVERKEKVNEKVHCWNTGDRSGDD